MPRSLVERWMKQRFEQDLILDAQEMVLAAVEVKLGYVLEEKKFDFTVKIKTGAEEGID